MASTVSARSSLAFRPAALPARSRRSLVVQARKTAASKAAAYICIDCGYIYDGREPFDKLPNSYRCPVCNARSAGSEPPRPRRRTMMPLPCGRDWGRCSGARTTASLMRGTRTSSSWRRPVAPPCWGRCISSSTQPCEPSSAEQESALQADAVPTPAAVIGSPSLSIHEALHYRVRLWISSPSPLLVVQRTHPPPIFCTPRPASLGFWFGFSL